MTAALPTRVPAPAAALALALLSACGRAGAVPSREPASAIPVRTEAVARGPVERPVRATGSVAARTEYDLGFHVGGRVASIAVDAGARVVKGQVLASLDATDAAAAVAQAREAAGKARRDAERARALRAEDVVPAATAQDADTGAAVAEAALRAAEWNLAHTVILAPENGWVDRRLAEPGEVVGAGRPVLHLSGTSRGWIVRAAVPEREVLGLAAGQGAEVILDARRGERIPGTIGEVARIPARGTGTYDVEIRLDAARAPPDLRAGLTARVEIPREIAAAGTVPLAALQEGDGEQGVVYAVAADGRARRVPVRVAFLQGDRVVLAGGLEGVDRVVVEGASRLADGVAVALAP